MILCHVIGRVVPSDDHMVIANASYLLVQPITSRGQEIGTPLVALDLVGANESEKVMVSQGSSVRQTEQTFDQPLDAVIAGIIDIVTIDNENVYIK